MILGEAGKGRLIKYSLGQGRELQIRAGQDMERNGAWSAKLGWDSGSVEEYFKTG